MGNINKVMRCQPGMESEILPLISKAPIQGITDMFKEGNNSKRQPFPKVSHLLRYHKAHVGIIPYV